MRTHWSVLALTMCCCSGGPAAGTATPADGGLIDNGHSGFDGSDAQGAVDASNDAPIGTPDAADGSSATDGGTDPRKPAPPADATLCGQGPITSVEAKTACLTDSGCVFAAPQCSAVATSGGEWQVWCSPSQTYLWARFDDVQSTGSSLCAKPTTPLQISGGALLFQAGCVSQLGMTLYNSTGTSTSALSFGSKVTAIATTTLGPHEHGSATLQATGGCQLTGGSAALLGATLTW